MIPAENEPFLDLARKALTGQATDQEVGELRALLNREATLNEQVDQLRKEFALVKELLPLVPAVHATSGRLPEHARNRLQAKIRRTLSTEKEELHKIEHMFERLVAWARGAENEEVRKQRFDLVNELPVKLVHLMRGATGRTAVHTRISEEALLGERTLEQFQVSPEVMRDKHAEELLEKLCQLREQTNKLLEQHKETLERLGHEVKEARELLEKYNAELGLARLKFEKELSELFVQSQVLEAALLDLLQ